MAWQSQGYQTVLVIGSISGETINLILKWDATVTTEALAEAAYVAFATDFLAVSAGALKHKSHQHGYYSDGYALPSSQDAEMGERAILVTNVEGDPTKTAVINIPFPITAVVYDAETGEGRNKVKSAGAEVMAYIDNWAAGAAMLSDGEKSAGNLIRGKRSGS